MTPFVLRVGPLIAALALLGACLSPGATPGPSASDSQPPEGTPRESGAPSAPPSPSAAPSQPTLAYDWDRLEMPEVGPEATILDLEATGEGYVALTVDALGSTAVLTSAEGRDWAAHQLPELARAGLVSLVERDGLLLAVGRDTTDVDVQRAMAWLSDDGGVAWREASAGSEFDGAQLIDVVATDEGFVAIGGYPTRDAAGAWTSPDGETWSAAPAIDEFQQAFIWSVTWGGAENDMLVAAGWRRSPDPEIGFDPAFWTSPDGAAWELAPTPAGSDGAQVLDVLAAGSGFVAVGDLLMGGQSFAWTSEDGSAWETTEPATFDEALAGELATVPGGILALGGRNGDDAGVWLSADGREWAIVEDAAFADAFLNGALAVDDDLILAGATQTRIEGTGSFTVAPMIWYGTGH